MNILSQAESIDSYLGKCKYNRANSLARQGARYQLSSISPAAAETLQTTARGIPLLDACDIVVLDSSADRGLPHTRPPNYVCLPASMCQEKMTNDFRVTLIHEAIHVHQRNYPDIWERELRRIGWAPVSPDMIPDDMVERARINPDTCMTPFWAWNLHHVPLPIFNNPPQLDAVQVKWFDTRNNTWNAQAPESFKKRYGTASYIEHPYEIYADAYSKRGLTTSEQIIENLSRE
jgi:hypothetical protein